MKALTEIRTVTGKNAVDFLANPDNHRYLEPFMEGECTMGLAAQRLGEPLGRVFRQVQRMLKLELIEQTRLETRTGRAIRHYRATSDTFFVAFSDKSLEEVLLEGNLRFERRFVAAIAAEWTQYAANNQGWGTTYARGTNGRLVQHAPVHVQPQTPMPHPPLVFSWYQQWKLGPDDAQALFVDMMALIERYTGKNSSGKQPFLVRVGMSPASHQD